MNTKPDQSYGIIPYATTVAGSIEYFLIHQYSHWRGDSYWGFPKGHAEAGETPEQAAMRELQEETELLLVGVNTTVVFSSRYQFEHDGELIDKTVSYFLAEAASRAYTLQEEEVLEAGWFSYEAALDRLSHQKTKDLLTSVNEYLALAKTWLTVAPRSVE